MEAAAYKFCWGPALVINLPPNLVANYSDHANKMSGPSQTTPEPSPPTSKLTENPETGL